MSQETLLPGSTGEEKEYTPTQCSIAALARLKPLPKLGLACGLAHLSLGHKTAKFLNARRFV